MLKYLDIVGGFHAFFGVLGSLFGLLIVGLGVLFMAYGLYDFVHGVVYLMEDPIYLKYAFDNLIQVAMLSAFVALPGLMVAVFYGLELFAGVAILKRWPKARIAGFAAVLPSFFLSFPGMMLAIGTVVVLVDEEVIAELEPA